MCGIIPIVKHQIHGLLVLLTKTGPNLL